MTRSSGSVNVTKSARMHTGLPLTYPLDPELKRTAGQKKTVKHDVLLDCTAAPSHVRSFQTLFGWGE